MTVRGLEFWGQHINLIAYLYTPFYWLGAGPTFLMGTQAACLGLGPHRCTSSPATGSSPWHGFAFTLVTCFTRPCSSVSSANYPAGHMIITPFLFFLWSSSRCRPVEV